MESQDLEWIIEDSGITDEEENIEKESSEVTVCNTRSAEEKMEIKSSELAPTYKRRSAKP